MKYPKQKLYQFSENNYYMYSKKDKYISTIITECDII
jgi:hypothetical protein